MARTYRNIEFANLNARNLAHKNYLTNELCAYEAIADSGFSIKSNRLRNAKGRIPTNYDDKCVSAYLEVDFNNG